MRLRVSERAHEGGLVPPADADRVGLEPPQSAAEAVAEHEPATAGPQASSRARRVRRTSTPARAGRRTTARGSSAARKSTSRSSRSASALKSGIRYGAGISVTSANLIAARRRPRACARPTAADQTGIEPQRLEQITARGGLVLEHRVAAREHEQEVAPREVGVGDVRAFVQQREVLLRGLDLAHRQLVRGHLPLVVPVERHRRALEKDDPRVEREAQVEVVVVEEQRGVVQPDRLDRVHA